MSDLAATVSGSFVFGAQADAAVVDAVTEKPRTKQLDPRLVFAWANETLDALLWRTLSITSGAVEQVLAANPGLADRGPFLPEGYPVIVPDLADVRTPKLDLIQLWD